MKDQPKKLLPEIMVFSLLRYASKRVNRSKHLMNDKEKQLTGLMKLSAQELANLNEWLDIDKVLVPRGIGSTESGAPK